MTPRAPRLVVITPSTTGKPLLVVGTVHERDVLEYIAGLGVCVTFLERRTA